MPISTISPAALKALIDSNSSLQLIHPLTEESFAQSHIPNSINLCVYEIAFEEKAKAQLDPETPTVAYGQNNSFEAASLASEKLAECDFKDIRILEGGLEGWIQKGYEVKQSAAFASSPDGRFFADLEKSRLSWIGRNLFNQHNGEIAIQEASLSFAEGHPAAGRITLNMQDIRCHDIEDSKLNQVLINHLSNSDFFLTDSHPTATFELERFEVKPKATDGTPNFDLVGFANVRGREQTITISAIIGWNPQSISVQGQFDLDRTQFGSKYGSGRFYESLGMHLVNDLISISFQLTFAR
ncbi:MAG: hypothetical protein F6K21_17790 [Symploca sp. SIO2D2]|nr:hypothetical protein [Symploca sp. SIO2D2]